MQRMKPPLKRRVPVVEDDPDVRKPITESLRAAGFDPLPAVDRAHALPTALARKPAVVVLDLGLPDFDGAQLIGRWRERRPDSCDLPIVVVSRRADRRASPASWAPRGCSGSRSRWTSSSQR